VQLLAKKLEQSEKENGSANPTSAKELNIIEQNVRLCRELLTMWQSYGSVEASPHKPISVTQIVREVVKGVGPMAVQSGVELQCDICDDPCTLLGDPVQIMRAIQNVIINALQASTEKKGAVTVSCTRKDFYVDVRVEDTGYGIAPAQMAKIFDPYFTTKQGKSGTGLGLYITKKVVEDHNGSIKVDSTPQVGTTFTIRLPLLNN
jgi:signal transduction histidine kinase